jgi:excisionase family DNA binding protein
MEERLLTIRECAQKLGVSESQLRELARQGKLPANKQAGRWLVLSSAIENVTPLRGIRRVRGRVAESTSLLDLSHRLHGRGTVVSQPKRRGKISPERAAESAAIDHQIDPESIRREPVTLPRGIKGKARAAQSRNLDLLEERLGKPHAPERSL